MGIETIIELHVTPGIAELHKKQLLPIAPVVGDFICIRTAGKDLILIEVQDCMLVIDSNGDGLLLIDAFAEAGRAENDDEFIRSINWMVDHGGWRLVGEGDEKRLAEAVASISAVSA